MTGAQLRKHYACAREAGMDDDTLHARCLAQTGRAHLRYNKLVSAKAKSI